MSVDQLSRRKTIAALAVLSACVLAGDSSASVKSAVQSPTGTFTGPTFSPTGPDAELYGAEERYPIPGVAEARRRGDPWEPKYRVGTFTHLDQIYQTRRVERATSPWKFRYSTTKIYYDFRGNRLSPIDYMSRNPVTGLLVAKDDQILFERYQYARTDHDRFVSQSMVKSIMGLLIGIAISDGAIKSVDDTSEAYVPGVRGTE